MWLEFLYALLAGALLLYGPGYLFFRGCGLSQTLSLCCAPLFGVCMYAGLPIVYFEFGITCSLYTVVGPALLIAILVYAIFWRQGSKTRLALSSIDPLTVRKHEISFDLVAPLVFVLVAGIVCYLMFIRALPSADAFVARHDNQTHLRNVRAFLESGKWSSLRTSIITNPSASAQKSGSPVSFYPCAWACVVVLCDLVTGVDLMIAANAVIALVASVVFPLSMYAFFRVLLPSRRRTILLGAIAITGFVNWPWQFLYSGPLLPNQIGISLQFAALAGLVALIERGDIRKHLISFASFGCIAFIALTLGHPSTVFSSYVFMAFYGAHLIAGTCEKGHKTAILVAYTCGVIALWTLFYHLPMLEKVTSYDSHEQAQLSDAIASLLNMGLTFTNTQLGMALCALLGCIALFRQQKRRWLLLPVAFFAFGYVAARIDLGPIKHWLSGFWYSDRRRMAINMVLYLMPVVAIGLDTLLPSLEGNKSVKWVVKLRLVACVILVMLVYLPSISVPSAGISITTPFGMAHKQLLGRYHESMYSSDEKEFVKRVMQTIPDGSLVINTPLDGSLWAYGASGLNTFCRYMSYNGELDDAALIRRHLVEYAFNQDVRDAVERLDARYVLQLDRGVLYNPNTWVGGLNQNHTDEWRGVSAINDDTPGFSVVLAEGEELRLYKIER